MNVDLVNTYAAKWTVGGWFLGLAYYNWFASSPPHVTWWYHLGLVTVGMFVASICIGGGMALLMALITKLVTGNAEGSIHGFAWAAFISPVLAFLFAGQVLTSVGGPPRLPVWIVLEFTMPNGEPAEMTFNNPKAPEYDLEKCKRLTGETQTNFVQKAREAAPSLQSATYKGFYCVASADDPIKPKS